MLRRSILGSIILVLVAGVSRAQLKPEPPKLAREADDSFAHEMLAKRIDEAALFHRVEDLAEVDKVRYTGPPPRNNPNPTAQGAGNPVIVTAYSFIPRKRPAGGTKLPLLVFVHGGVHGNFDT